MDNRAILSNILTKHGTKIYKTIRAISSRAFKNLPHIDDEDVFHNACIKFIQYNKRSFETENDLIRYLYRIFVNEYNNEIRRKCKIKEKYSEDFEYLCELLGPQCKKTSQRYENMYKYMDMLPEKHKEIFEYKYIDSLSVKEIAQKINKTPNFIHNRLYKIRQILRRKLKCLQ